MAKAIMIQGTMSNAGKSLLAAGLCRIFRQDGYRVAPFKSQNMALNSFITTEGLEMGRAQVVQAQAAGAEPCADMNPILLKPSSDTGSQVIVRGVPIGTMPAKEYFQYKKQLIPVIREAYQRLDRQYDIIVIEGAGSPAEINLKQDDIVNMGMAKMANAPVLLAGDIDRGGVFAQLYGTVMLLEPEERAMVKGIIINKFRGDKTILDPGVLMIEELLGIPAVGVIPYMDVDIEDEDSLSSRLELKRKSNRPEAEHGEGLIEIAVIRFPRLSNFTDFTIFEQMEAVKLRYVDRISVLGKPDLIILPGTKNTMDDLLWLRQNGLENAVLKAASAGTPVWGICGGYQMMGRTLYDENNIESKTAGGHLAGMGLLPTATHFHEEKTRTRVRGTFGRLDGIFSELEGMETEGYEIHMGESFIDETALKLLTLWEGSGAAVSAPGKPDGCFLSDCYGTYLHGVFDAPGIAEAVVNALLAKRGLPPLIQGQVPFDYSAYRESQYDKLADTLRNHLDMAQLYRILEDGLQATQQDDNLR